MRALTPDPEFWADRRVLVTGHTGFKGSWLTLWLQSLGARVIGLSPGAPTTPALYEAARVGDQVAQHRVDVRDAEAVLEVVQSERPELVFHLAAQPMVRRSLQEPRATYEINVMGTVNVLDAVRQVGGVAGVVVVTSDKCYANSDHGAARRAFVEDDPMGGSDPYSSSKGCAELVAASYRESYFGAPDGTRLATARAGNVIGGGDWGEDRLIPDLIRAAEAGRPVSVRSPDAVRPWQHVLNPLSGYLVLAQELARGAPVDEAFNFGPRPDDIRPVQWIAERFVELWPGATWELDVGSNPPEAGFLSLDSGKALDRLGWRPAWDLDEALARIVQWHQAFRGGEDVRELCLGQIEQFAAAEGVAA